MGSPSAGFGRVLNIATQTCVPSCCNLFTQAKVSQSQRIQDMTAAQAKRQAAELAKASGRACGLRKQSAQGADIAWSKWVHACMTRRCCVGCRINMPTSEPLLLRAGGGGGRAGGAGGRRAAGPA